MTFNLEQARNPLPPFHAPLNGAISVQRVKEAVALSYKVTVDALESASRTHRLTRPRQVAMYLSRTMTGQSYPQIARSIGDRDHSTIIFGFRKIAKLIEKDEKLKARVDEIAGQIEALQ